MALSSGSTTRDSWIQSRRRSSSVVAPAEISRLPSTTCRLWKIPRPLTTWRRCTTALGWVHVDAVERLAGQVAERNGQDLARAVDLGQTEVLHALGRRPVLLHPGGHRHVLHVGAEGAIDLTRPERARVDGAGHELPERREVGELGLGRVIVGRRGVVHVGGHPYDV